MADQLNREDVLAKIAKARDTVSDLCTGKKNWTMSVPARPESDPDLVIADALSSAADLLSEEQADQTWNEAIDVARLAFLRHMDMSASDIDAAIVRLRKPSQTQEPVSGAVDEQAPPHSLPDWSLCQLIIDNHEFRQRAAEGLEGQVLDTPPTTPMPTALRRFIYEYDDADPHRSAWFMHRLELVLQEARAQQQPAAQTAVPEGWKLVLVPTGWTFGPNVFKDWCSQWFGPDSDDEYLIKAVDVLINHLPAAPQPVAAQVGEQDKASNGNGFYTFTKPEGWINLRNPGQSWVEWTKEQGAPTTKGWFISGAHPQAAQAKENGK